MICPAKMDIADRGTITGPFIPTKSAQSRLIGGYRDLRGRYTTDCLVTTITVTLCDRRDSTDVEYPPIGTAASASCRSSCGSEIWSVCAAVGLYATPN